MGTISDKILKDRAYEIALNSKDDGYQRGLASMVFNIFDEKIRSIQQQEAKRNLRITQRSD